MSIGTSFRRFVLRKQIGACLATVTIGGLVVLAMPIATTHRDVMAMTSVNSSSSKPGYFNIGHIHREITTESDAAQLWFDRGLAMCHGFNHEEAIACFEQAIQADPMCAMAYWGMAYAWGPNINNMNIEHGQIGQAALAIRLAGFVNKQLATWETELIGATAQRYALPIPEDRTGLNQAYADAMRNLYRKYPDNRLVVALFAESLMDLRPWKLWSSDGTPAPETPEILAVLDDGLKRWPDDPMLCHLYIHAIEASPTPEKGLNAADQLRKAGLDLGHLVHMPSHIDIRLGNYQRVINDNELAIAADKKFVAERGRLNFYTIYRIHNYHFVTYGAMFDGQSRIAIQAARELVNELPVELLTSHRDFLDPFVAVPFHAMIRFGLWDDILKESEPSLDLPMTKAIRHYARGVALAATNRVKEAEFEQSRFLELKQHVPDTSMFHNNSSQKITDVAEAMLEGEIAYRRGEYERAFHALRRAVELEDSLNYDEPWGWMQPTRHALGALLLEQGKAVEAELVYRADLKRHPKNPWSLHGLVECLALRQSPELATVSEQLREASRRSDIQIDRSCLCRQTCCSTDTNK